MFAFVSSLLLFCSRCPPPLHLGGALSHLSVAFEQQKQPPEITGVEDEDDSAEAAMSHGKASNSIHSFVHSFLHSKENDADTKDG